MKRLIAFVCVASLLAWATLTAGAQDETPSIKKVMAKLNKGPKALTGAIKKELSADSPDWDKIQMQAKEYVIFAGHLGKNEPPKGEKPSWEKLTKQYVDNAKALEEAAKNKDKETALKAQAKLAGACKGCHSQHK